MNYKDKTKEQLIEELIEIGLEVAKLKTLEDLHKQTEERLRESEEKYRLMVENANEPILVAQDGLLKFANAKAAEVIGYQLDELTSRPFVDFIHPDDREIVIKRHMKRLKGDEIPQIYPFRIINKNGNVMWAEINVVLIKWEERPATLFLIRDITERKHAEESLKESEEKYRTLIDQSLYGVLIIQDQGIVFVNPALARIVGYTIDELLAFSPEEMRALVHSEDRAFVEERIRDRFMGKSVPQRYTFRMNRKDGSTRWIESSTNLINYLGKPAVQGILLDITESKQAEELLRDSEEKFRQLAEQSPNMIFIYKNGRVVYANKKCEEVVGYTQEEFYSPDFDFLRLIAPEYRKLIVANLSKHMEGEEIAPYDYSLITKNGKRIEAIITSKLIDYNVERAILGIVTDITERKRTEEALEQRVRELDLLNKARSSLAKGLDLSLVIRTVVEGIVETFGYTLVSLYLLKGDVLILQHQVGYHKEIPKIPITKGVSGRVVRTGEPVLLEDVRTAPEFLGAIENIASEICVPLFDQDKVVGTLNVESKVGKYLTKSDLRLMTALGEYVSVAIGKARLYEAAQREITERKKIESQLIESEKKYRTLIDQSLQGITILQDGFIKFANPAFAEISGYTIEELLNFSPEDVRVLVYSEDRENVQEWIRGRFIGKPNSSRYDFRITRKDGSVRWLDASVTLIEYQGKPANQVTFVDITKRKHAEEEMRKYTENLEKLVDERTKALKTSEMQLRAILTGIGDSITIQNKDLDIIWTNQQIRDIYGNVTGRKCYEVYHQAKEKCPNCTVQTVFQKRETLTSENSVIRPNGEQVEVLVTSSPIRDDQENIFAVIEVAKDIRELKKMETQLKEYAEELKESEERYRGLYESSIDGIAFTNMEAKIVDCNQAFADMLGYTKEELYQLTLWDLTPSKWLNMNKKIFTNQVYVKGYSDEYEKEYIKKDGTIIPVSARAWVIKDKEGKPTGSWGIVRDITERKKVDQMKSKFINVAAHELRTPLSALKAHIDLLKIKISRGFWSLPEEVNKKINIIARNADRLALLINNLLDYTRLEAGTLKMSSELSSLENLAIENVREVNLLAKKHKHELTIITPQSLPLMHLDKEKINAIFNNLLSNAIKYTPEGGTINVLLTELDDNIHIMVKDNGIGIAEDDLESIFLPFYVADLNTTDRLQIQPEFERTGLGLAITKEYVKMHDGSIWVESQVGKGSTFHVILPMSREN